MSSVLRIIDANTNRAREAMRVMEEAARFVLNDAPLTEQIKTLRHDFSQLLATIDGLEFNRDTPGDVGTSISTENESNRASVAEVAIAAGKRLSEALRAIEEYGKTLGGESDLSSRIEQLRYRGYEIEKRLNNALSTFQPKQWRLCLLLTESLCKRPWIDVLATAVEAGVDCVQVREKDMDAALLRDRVKKVLTFCNGRAAVIVNDHPDVAITAGADGVHLGQTDLSCREVRSMFGQQLIIGVSTSKIAQAKAAFMEGADYCGVGPMFNTSTKEKDVIVGPDYLKQFIETFDRPHLAIGGINVGNIGKLVEAGVQGVAVSSAICAADDPGAVVQKIIESTGSSLRTTG
jgi:thiamine-phosphate pyrophosphorylase